ncbi:MAG TPA: TSUP family transporter [Burkholderiales bacterium]|nr:TSUP family transporter [Burkholderiales bacterium]
MDLVFLCAAALVAGLLDAVVGGGGLVQIPALFSAMPNAAPAAVFGTNKLSSIFGTGSAALRYSHTVHIRWNAVLPAAITAFIFSYLGALTVSLIPADLMRVLVVPLLIVVAVYTFFKKDMGSAHAPLHEGAREKFLAIALGAGIGFYDGFFGPGTGSFLVFLFVRFFGFDFLRASAAAKVVNVATNFAALLYFIPSGNLIWQLGLLMAAFNMAGSLLGTRLAIRHGSGFVRQIFLLVVSALILKFGYDTFLN